MTIMLALLATASAALFAGAALYINLVEHPARMACGTPVALSQWEPSYRRATRLQAPLAVISALSALAVFLTGGSVYWLVAAIVIGAVVPYTFVFIMRINRRLHSLGEHDSDAVAHALLTRWNRLHSARTLLSLLALALDLVLLSGVGGLERL